MPELGLTGLRRFNGYVYEEYDRKLTGDKAIKIYEEMVTYPTIGACLQAIDLLMRQVEWYFEGDDTEDESTDPRIEFLESKLDGLSYSWTDTISEILSMVPFGWSYHETVYRLDPDGTVGWDSFPIRAQSSKLRWEFNDNGTIKGMWQLSPPTYRLTFLPIGKCLLFRPAAHKNNPEGSSALRRAYRPWYFAKNLERLEAIGVERDVAGLPIVWLPPEMMATNAKGERVQAYEEYKKLVTNIRRDEQEGICFPLQYDDKGNKLFDLTLLSTQGGTRRADDLTTRIQRYCAQMAQTMLADFLLLGHEKVGSFALADSKTNLFAVALGAWLDAIASVMNHDAVPRLLALNGMDTEDAPRLCHGDIETPDLDVLGNYLSRLAGAGMSLFPDLQTENRLRGFAGLPTLTAEAFESREAALEEQQQAELDAQMQMIDAKANAKAPVPPT